jgi:hypothetical protein
VGSFSIGIKLEAVYDGDAATWMALHISSDTALAERCMIEDDSSEILREHIEDVRNIAKAFDKARWRTYPRFIEELRAYRRRR